MSSKSLEDYQVLNVIEFGNLGNCFKIRDKTTGELFVWKSIDYGSLTESKKQILLNELKVLNEKKHKNVVQYIDYIIHLVSSTVYIVMEWCPGGNLATLIDECKKSGNLINEEFIWKILYQTSQALNFFQSKLKDTSFLAESINSTNIFLDADGNAKLGDYELSRLLQIKRLDYDFSVESSFFNSFDAGKNKEMEPKTVISALGSLIYELASLCSISKMSSTETSLDLKNQRLPPISSVYSEDLQNILQFLRTSFDSTQPSIKMILHHPTVVKKIKSCVWNSKDFSKFFQNKCAIDSTKNKPFKNCNEKHLLSLIEMPPAEKRIYSENICEKTFQEKWLSRIEAIRKKESELKMKEEKLDEKERYILKKEKQVFIMEKLAKEKNKRAEIYLKQCKEFRVRPKVKNVSLQRNKPAYNIDTSFSADPGDTSILPTVAKINLDTIFELKNIKDEKLERHVKFNNAFPTRFAADAKLSSENKENISQPKSLLKKTTDIQDFGNRAKNDNLKSTTSLKVDVHPKSTNKTSTISLKLSQPFKSDVLRKSFLSKSCSLKFLGKKTIRD